MSRRLALGVWPRIVVVGLMARVLCFTPAHAAENDPQDALIRAQIAAGEFAPAVAAARAAADPQRRDRLLAEIAVAQAAVGAREGALRTVAEMYDDRNRAEALSRIAAQLFGGRGGGAQADFDPLIELITSTIAPASWETVGGPGAIAPFATGVYVDAQGVLRPLMKQKVTGTLGTLHAASAVQAGQEDVRRSSPLRKVSLPRLEKQIQLRLAAGRGPTEAMQVLAGLQRIEYVFVYPDTGDLVLAGPAGDWALDGENRIVGSDTGLPVLRLDDLVVVLRHMMSGPDARFGCAIVPTQQALARTQLFLNESNPDFRNAADREAWLEQLRSRLGKQQIDVYGLDPRTRAARVMVEADYRMKLVGMGLEEGVPGVESYLESIRVRPGEAPPPMGVLRWWFTLDYDAVLASQDGSAFAVRGQGVKVLSENELLTAEGKRVHTGESEELNRQFARSFTQHFAALCRKYPVYAELRNVFDLALVGALIQSEELAQKAAWHLTCFGDAGAYSFPLGPAPKQVETVANYRTIRSGTKIHTISGVSGGVRVDPARLVTRRAIEIDRYSGLEDRRSAAAVKGLPAAAWWWD
ncbi:MAG TPA: DUF1598 domain-containing protein [Thermoguttaceae bacterium]|nr:DUF1598 domain-containing protein [Thermoguttaceae bacterium]